METSIFLNPFITIVLEFSWIKMWSYGSPNILISQFWLHFETFWSFLRKLNFFLFIFPPLFITSWNRMSHHWSQTSPYHRLRRSLRCMLSHTTCNTTILYQGGSFFGWPKWPVNLGGGSRWLFTITETLGLCFTRRLNKQVSCFWLMCLRVGTACTAESLSFCWILLSFVSFALTIKRNLTSSVVFFVQRKDFHVWKWS